MSRTVPLTVPVLVFWALQGSAAFPAPTVARNALLIGTGPLSAVPLVLFAAGVSTLLLTIDRGLHRRV